MQDFKEAIRQVIDTFTLGHGVFMKFEYEYEGRTKNELANNHLDHYYNIAGGPFKDIFQYGPFGEYINNSHHAQGNGFVLFAASDFLRLIFKVDPDFARELIQEKIDKYSKFPPLSEITITKFTLSA